MGYMATTGGHRRIGAATLVLILSFTIVTAWPARAAGGDASADRLVTLTNRARADAGLAAYGVSADLVEVARGQAQRMAAEHRIYHNPDLATEVTGWQKVAENVGEGADADQVHQLFMESSIHREHVLWADATDVGIATELGDDGQLYVAEVFRVPDQQADAAPAPESAPAPPPPAPEPEPPAPVSEPAPAPAPVAAEPTTVAPVTTPSAPAVVRSSVAPEAHPIVRRLISQQVTAVAHVAAPPEQPPALAVWTAAGLALAVCAAHLVLMRRTQAECWMQDGVITPARAEVRRLSLA
jgi:hypothetical protein